ncbi:MAG: tetratricopeptide repeat protein, partial [Gammaproteobacteria bacterium]|nr:tetratricopeptide repeat protein [Gammaproteobacteria bacterium]
PTDFVVPDTPDGDLQPAVWQQVQKAGDRARKNPADPDALGRYAMVLHAYGFYEPAAQLYARARRIQPAAFPQAYLHGHTLLAMGRTKESIAAYQRAAQLDPALGSTGLGNALLEAGDTASAKAAFLQALEHNESDHKALYELGRLALAAEDLGAAEQFLSRAAGSEHPPAQVFYALAQVEKQRGNEERAANLLLEFEQAKQRGGGWYHPLTSRLKGLRRGDRQLVSEAQRAIKQGDIHRAIRLNEQARAADPENPLPTAALINLYALVGEHEKSEEALKSARSLDPESAQLYFNIGLARLFQKRLPEAEEAFTKVTKIDPQGSLAWIQLGSLYATQGKESLALAAFRNAHERDPRNDAVRLRLGVLYLDKGQHEAATGLLADPVATKRGEMQRLLALGRAYRLQGDAETARSRLEEAEAAAIEAGDSRLAAGARSEIDQIDASADN